MKAIFAALCLTVLSASQIAAACSQGPAAVVRSGKTQRVLESQEFRDALRAQGFQVQIVQIDYQNGAVNVRLDNKCTLVGRVLLSKPEQNGHCPEILGVSVAQSCEPTN